MGVLIVAAMLCFVMGIDAVGKHMFPADTCLNDVESTSIRRHDIMILVWRQFRRTDVIWLHDATLAHVWRHNDVISPLGAKNYSFEKVEVSVKKILHWKIGGTWLSLFAILQWQWRHTVLILATRVHTDVRGTSSRCHSSKVLSTTVDTFIFAIVTDHWRHVIYNSRRAWHTLSQPGIRTIEKCSLFFEPIIHSRWNLILCYTWTWVHLPVST